MDTDAALQAEVTASLNASLEHDRDRALFGDDLRPTSSDAPAAAALDPDPQTPPLAEWTPPPARQGGMGRGARRRAGGRALRERPAARHADRRHRPPRRHLDHDRPGGRQPTRHRDRGHDKRPAAPVRPHGLSTAAGGGTRRTGAKRRTAEPMTCLAGGGYSGRFWLVTTNAAESLLNRTPQVNQRTRPTARTVTGAVKALGMGSASKLE